MRISGPVWHSQIDPENLFRRAKKKKDANQPVHRSPLRSAGDLFYWLVEFSKLSPFHPVIKVRQVSVQAQSSFPGNFNRPI
jgi:hypothetical protein